MLQVMGSATQSPGQKTRVKNIKLLSFHAGLKVGNFLLARRELREWLSPHQQRQAALLYGLFTSSVCWNSHGGRDNGCFVQSLWNNEASLLCCSDVACLAPVGAQDIEL
jgi:hypothetical protein